MKSAATMATAIALGIGSFLGTSAAHADPIELSWVSSGQAGDWTVNFTFHNKLQPAPADMRIYLLGVFAPSRSIAGSPAGWDADYLIERTDYYAFYHYNNNWYFDGDSGFTPGTSVSGFKIHMNTEEAPTVFHWFAAAGSPSGGYYTGGEQTFGPWMNPVFQRTSVQASSVPEPEGLLLAGAGIAALALAGSIRRVTRLRTN